VNASRLVSSLSILVLLALAGPANAAQSYDNCTGFIDSVPATITTQGVWCLRADLSTAIGGGNAITIATNNVTIDCNHFKLGGLAAGPGTGAMGIYALGRLNATIRNCNIRGFFHGILISGAGGGHVIEDSRFDGNTYVAIRINADSVAIRNNHIVETGGSTIYSDAFGMGIESGSGIDVSGNTVSGVTATTGNANANGIWLGSTPELSVRNNLVRGLLPSGTGSSYGIISIAATGVVIDGNIVHGPGSAGSVGITCSNTTGTATRNTVRRFATGVSNCVQLDNVVNNN